MLYAISLHLSIERDALVGMTAADVVAMAAENGDLVTEARAEEIIECATADKEAEAKAEAEASQKKGHARK